MGIQVAEEFGDPDDVYADAGQRPVELSLVLVRFARLQVVDMTSEVLVAECRRHKTRQNVERLAAGPSWADSDYVFTTPIGTPIDPRNLTRLYHGLTERAGLGRGRFHALRHSAATIMHALGVPLEVISKTLGRAGYAITADIYANVGKKVERDAADAIDRAFAKSS